MELPAALFKYCPPERVDILEGLKIRFSQPAVFNDIFECLPGTDQTTDFQAAFQKFALGIQAQLANHPEWDRKTRRAYEREEARKFEKWCKAEKSKGHHERLCEEVQLRSSSIMGILCLSGKWDNVLMWSHYSRDHQGFVIEFAGDNPFFGKSVVKVDYSNERPILGNRRDGWNDGALFETKSKDWEYEDEYRKFEYFGKTRSLPNGNTLVEFPESKDIDSKNWPLRLVDFPPDSIRKVILGYRIAEEPKQKILKALKDSRLKHVLCSQARPHRNQFRMEEIPVKQ